VTAIMPSIEVFADIVCPFTHVGLKRLIVERRRRGAAGYMRVRAWPLAWINGAPLSVEIVAHEIEALRAQVAPDTFAGFSAATFPRTSIPAFGLVAAGYALSTAAGESLSLAVRDALFEGGLDISDPRVLADLGERWGVVPFDLPTSCDAARADWERGTARGVQGSPHFFVGDRDWFCPSLRISKRDGEFQIELEREALDKFYASATV
jgi:predicted DsbA family dithiol-disulfide isomerase